MWMDGRFPVGEVELCLAGVMLAGERGFGRIVVETTNVVAQTGYEDLVASPCDHRWLDM